ncbi:hypothetical protein M0804_001688 [Polistes exclamans]|nr:hypothetical protein M0804_001688 [Polistes exclamans]
MVSQGGGGWGGPTWGATFSSEGKTRSSDVGSGPSSGGSGGGSTAVADAGGGGDGGGLTYSSSSEMFSRMLSSVADVSNPVVNLTHTSTLTHGSVLLINLINLISL